VAPATFDALSECSKELLQLELEKNNDAVVKQQVQREMELLEKMSELERKVRAARKHIEGELLVLSCPACQKTFAEWSECGAVECHDDRGNGCGIKFCCYCQKNLSQDDEDPHTHVLDCPVAGPKPADVESKLYPPKWYTGQVHARVWKARVQGFVETLEDDIRREVMQQCRRAFFDLGMGFPEIEENNQDWDQDIAMSLELDEGE
jgi:hypothetical protein